MKRTLSILLMLSMICISTISCKRKFTCTCEGDTASGVVSTRKRYKADSLTEAETKCYDANPGLSCTVH